MPKKNVEYDEKTGKTSGFSFEGEYDVESTELKNGFFANEHGKKKSIFGSFDAQISIEGLEDEYENVPLKKGDVVTIIIRKKEKKEEK